MNSTPMAAESTTPSTPSRAGVRGSSRAYRPFWSSRLAVTGSRPTASTASVSHTRTVSPWSKLPRSYTAATITSPTTMNIVAVKATYQAMRPMLASSRWRKRRRVSGSSTSICDMSGSSAAATLTPNRLTGRRYRAIA